MNDYLLAIMYGDGYFQMKEGRESFLFSTTHKELASRVSKALSEKNYRHTTHSRTFGEGHEKANYEILEIVESYDVKLKSELENHGFKSQNASDRIKINSDFLRGYLETKGTLFKSSSRGTEFWRMSFSGNYEDISYIKTSLEQLLDIKFSNIVRRKEREKLGIISKSFRINIQNREGLAKLIDFLKGEEVTEYLGQRTTGFEHFHKHTPFNMKKKVFKHYKYAVAFMTRELGVVVKGKRGGGGSRGYKPVYLMDGDIEVLEFKGWQDAYSWVCKEYQEKTGFTPPKVEPE